MVTNRQSLYITQRYPIYTGKSSGYQHNCTNMGAWRVKILLKIAHRSKKEADRTIVFKSDPQIKRQGTALKDQGIAVTTQRSSVSACANTRSMHGELVSLACISSRVNWSMEDTV